MHTYYCWACHKVGIAKHANHQIYKLMRRTVQVCIFPHLPQAPAWGIVVGDKKTVDIAGVGAVVIKFYMVACLTSLFFFIKLIKALLTCIICSEVPHDLCPLSICSVSLPHSLHLNPVSSARLEGGQSVGGVTVGRLGDIDGAILGGVGHSEGVALGIAGWPGDTQNGDCPRSGQREQCFHQKGSLAHGGNIA